MKKHVILVVTANPQSTQPLQLAREARSIRQSLRGGRYGQRYRVEEVPASRLKDLRRALLDHRPTIVHFSGHGDRSGLKLEEDDGIGDVSGAVLADLFRPFREDLRCVVLAACSSKQQAERIAEHVDFVVGIDGLLDDRLGAEFASAFYDALADGRTIPKAFNLARHVFLLDTQVDMPPAQPVFFGKPEQPSRSPWWRWSALAALWVLGLWAVLSFFVSQFGAGHNPSTHSALIYTTDPDGHPIHGTEILALFPGGPSQTVTDSAGAANLDIPESVNAAHLVMQAAGFRIHERSWEPGRDAVVRVRLQQPSSQERTLLLRLVDSDTGEPIPLAEVQVVLGADVFASTSDDQGLTRFHLAVAKEVVDLDVSVQATGYRVFHQLMASPLDTLHLLPLEPLLPKEIP